MLFIQHYKDLILNTLDLISFVLVTPELVRIITPSMKRAYALTLFILIFVIPIVGAFYILVFLKWSLGSYYEEIHRWVWYNVSRSVEQNVDFVISLPIAAVLYLPVAWFVSGLDQRVEASKHPLSTYAFGCGVFVFFASRLIGFAVAAYETATRA